MVAPAYDEIIEARRKRLTHGQDSRPEPPSGRPHICYKFATIEQRRFPLNFEGQERIDHRFANDLLMKPFFEALALEKKARQKCRATPRIR